MCVWYVCIYVHIHAFVCKCMYVNMHTEFETVLSKFMSIRLNGILPKMLLCGGAALWDRLLQLMQVIWRDGEVVTD